MNLGPLVPLGKVAGIGGIALGAVVLLGSQLTSTVASLPAGERAFTVQLLAGGCFGIGVVGLVVWAMGVRAGRASATTAGDSSPAIIGHNVSVNAPAATAPRGGGSAAKPAAGVVATKGADSAAILASGNVAVNTTAPKAKKT